MSHQPKARATSASSPWMLTLIKVAGLLTDTASSTYLAPQVNALHATVNSTTCQSSPCTTARHLTDGIAIGFGIDVGFGMKLKNNAVTIIRMQFESQHQFDKLSTNRINLRLLQHVGPRPSAPSLPLPTSDRHAFALSPRYAASSGAVLIMIQFTLRFRATVILTEFAGSSSCLPNPLGLHFALLFSCHVCSFPGCSIVAKLERHYKWNPQIWNGLIPAINSNNG